jgi:hypothetical protein
MQPPPVRVKVYGLISLTKRAYLICVVIGGLGMVALLVLWFLTAGTPTPAEKAGKFPLTPFYIWRNYAPWLLAAAVLIEGIEVYVVLKRFRRAEAERQKPAAADPTPKGS